MSPSTRGAGERLRRESLSRHGLMTNALSGDAALGQASREASCAVMMIGRYFGRDSGLHQAGAKTRRRARSLDATRSPCGQPPAMLATHSTYGDVTRFGGICIPILSISQKGADKPS